MQPIDITAQFAKSFGTKPARELRIVGEPEQTDDDGDVRNAKIQPGTRVGHWVVTEYSKTQYGPAWLCVCDCGRSAIVRDQRLRVGRSKSCGCRRGDSGRTHGYSGSPTYRTWKSMWQRCINPADGSYRHYGGRGIEVCARWLKFENFLADMGERPPGLTLDRIDNDRNYEPDNCRWATRGEQAVNRRRTHRVEYQGRSIALPALAQMFELDRRLLYGRIVTCGWDIERAISELRHSNSRSGDKR